ncbi:MAG: general secretion pathway protein GspE [Planctomycetota bacterium]|nr:MAG: general secretion pathway protein GspE [Planctomycetota bacterium]
MLVTDEKDFYKDWLGIPEGPRPPDHYTLLRLVQFEDDEEKIRAHYKKLNAHVRKYATGKYSIQSQEMLNELAKAMLCLTDPERKREYDESLGRVFEEDKSKVGRPLLKNWLREKGYLTREQIREAEEFAEERGLSLRDALVQLKLVDHETAAKGLAVELGLPYVDLSEVEPDWDALRKVPKSVVKRNSILPLFVDDDRVLVACVDEPSYELEDEIRLRFGVPMRGVIASPPQLRRRIDYYYVEQADKLAKSDGDGAAAASRPERSEQSRPGKSSPAPRKRFSQLSPAEQHERRMLGIIMLCWGLAGPVLIDQFVVKPMLPPSLRFGWLPSLTTLLVTPAVFWYVLARYWR